MRAALICVGALKEAYWQSAVAEYEKRLTRYHKLELIQLKDEPDDAPPERVKAKEGERILAHIKPDDHVIALAIHGKTYTSEALAAHLDDVALRVRGRVVFLIGGSLGLSDAVYARADEQLSFSPLTFPHQLMRVMFLEQLYRAAKISAGEKYHK